MAETLNGVAFAVLALVTVGAAVAMMWTRNIVHAAFLLLAVSLATVGTFMLLDADYLALVQLLVYAGAVAILLIFTIMITLRRREDAIRDRDFSWAGLILAVGFFTMIAMAVLGWTPGSVKFPEQAPTLVSFGKLLFSPDGWAFPFEIASLVLTAALIGAVWWSREGDE